MSEAKGIDENDPLRLVGEPRPGRPVATARKGRPYRAGAPATYRVDVRLTASEFQQLAEASAKARVSNVDMLRRLLFDALEALDDPDDSTVFWDGSRVVTAKSDDGRRH